MLRCAHCLRRWRSKEAHELYLKRRAVFESLRDGTPCAHLAPLNLPEPSKIDRHRSRSQDFRAGVN